MKKKIAAIVVAVVLVLAAAGGAVWWFFLRTPSVPEDGSDIAYVTAVKDILTNGGLGTSTRFTGVVEPQQTLEIQKDESKKIAELYVTVGQEVKAGDKLFSYDMDDLELQMQEAELQLQNLDNRIQTLNKQIESLIEERDNAPEDERFSYTLQIQSTQLEVRSTEYDRTVKAREIEQLSGSVFSTDVTAAIDGIIQSINDGESGGYDMYGNPTSNAYITILATGEYRVKATVTELNIGSLQQGMKMRVTSRVDGGASWTGTVDEIDYEPITNNSGAGIYYGSENTFTPASKYNFYIKLDDFSGLILGQHVYVEPDIGSVHEKTGIWLPGYYIFTEDMESFVWADSGRNTLEKRRVSLGQYDEALDEFEILSGLKTQDRIAVPAENLYEGMYAQEGVAAPSVGGEEVPDGGMLDLIPEDGSETVPPEDGAVEGGIAEDWLPEDGAGTDDDAAENGSIEANTGETDGTIDGSNTVDVGP